MDFKFTEEQLMIRDTAAAFLAEVCTSEAVRTAMATELGYNAELWRRIGSEMYWPTIHIPEQYGGMGLGYVELAALLEQMGRRLLCAPFFSTVCLATNALLVAASESQKAEYLPRIVAGTTATLAWRGEKNGWSAAAVEATYSRTDGGYQLTGSWRYVVDGHSAQLLVLAAREQGSSGDEGISLFVLSADTPGVEREWLPTMDQTRKLAAINLNGAVLAEDAVMGEPGKAAQSLNKILDLATIAVVAEQVGGAQQALDMSVAYVQERVQFGRTIASYQAVKHKAADMMVKAEAGRSALYYAACVADEALRGGSLGEELSEAASISKSWCSDAYFHNAGSGIQLHGAVGFTWEYDMQLYFKRAKSSEAFLGNAAEHRERLAAALLD